jgi:hypothetical protein
MRKHNHSRPVAVLLVAAFLFTLIAPAAQAIQSPPTQQEEQQNVAHQKQGFFAYFLSLLSFFDRNRGTEPPSKRNATDTGSLIGTEPVPDPEPLPETTGGGEDDPDGRPGFDPNG